MAKVSFTDYALNLPQEDVYFLCAAVRGPDYQTAFNDELLVLKHEVVGRLRAILFVDGFGESRETTPLTDARFTEVLAPACAVVAKGGFIHFVDHLVSAISVTEAHPIWGGLTLAHRLVTALRGG